METGHRESGSALRSESPRRERHRRRSQFGGLAAGAVAGLVVGVLIEWALGSERLTGHADDPFSLAFGLLLGTAREPAVEDAPVRVGRFRRLGRAATSRQGQLPGSPVPPARVDDRER